MAKKSKTLGANLPVPQNREEAAAAIADLGTTSRAVARIEADMNDEIAAAKLASEKQAKPLREREAALREGLKIWAEANREALTQGGKVKFADLGTGKISWRQRPPSVRITGAERVIEAIKRLGMNAFLRVKEEPNKEAMLADADNARLIAGVTISSDGEDFIVEPFEAEISEGIAA